MDQGTLSTKVRVLDVAYFAPKVQVMVGNRIIADGLDYGMLSDYQRVTDGFRRVSVINQESRRKEPADSNLEAAGSFPQEEVISDTLPFCGGRQITLVFCNTMNGISLIPMEELSCYAGKNRGCIRFANFSFGDGPFDVLDADGNVAFLDIMPREITQPLPAEAGDYEFSIVRTGSEYVPESELASGQ